MQVLHAYLKLIYLLSLWSIHLVYYPTWLHVVFCILYRSLVLCLSSLLHAPVALPNLTYVYLFCNIHIPICSSVPCVTIATHLASYMYIIFHAECWSIMLTLPIVYIHTYTGVHYVKTATLLAKPQILSQITHHSYLISYDWLPLVPYGYALISVGLSSCLTMVTLGGYTPSGLCIHIM